MLSATTKVVICSGLNEMINSNNNSKEDQAWSLRYTIDAIIADLQGFDRSSSTGKSNNLSLPTKKEAELMDLTCIGRTSPSEGTLYDMNGYMIDVDIDVDADVNDNNDVDDVDDDDDDD